MRTAVTLAAIALAATAPTVATAAARNPAASLGVAQPPQGASSGAGQGSGQQAGDAVRPTLPVPGYQFIAAGLLLGIAGVFFAFTQQDDTPDSN